MKKMGLASKTFIGLFLGVIIGIIFKEKAAIIEPLGTVFLKLLRMGVPFLVSASIISGITNLTDVKSLRRIGTKTIVYYTLTTALAAVVGLVVSNILKPGVGFMMESVEKFDASKVAEQPSFLNTLLNMIPSNAAESFSTGNLIQIIVFSVFLGIAIVLAGEKGGSIKGFIKDATEVMFQLFDIVMQFAPIGVMALIASSVGKYGMDVAGPLGLFFLTDYIGAIIILFGVYAVVLKGYVGIPLMEFYKRAIKVWAVTLGTCSSSATLPVTLDTMIHDFKAPDEVVGFSIPLGATINMDGAANYFAVITIFVANIYGVHLSLADMALTILLCITLSMGLPGLPNASLLMTIAILTTFGLPLDVVGLVMGLYRIIDMAHTTVNVTGDMVASLVVAKSEKLWSYEKMKLAIAKSVA